MKIKHIISFLAGVIIVLLFMIGKEAFAWEQMQDQKQVQKQNQKQMQSQEMSNVVSTTSTASVSGVSAAGGDSSMEYNSVVESSAPDIIMVPSNNTSDCMKVYGLSFSNTGGGGGLGWPYRDKACDFESAADDAAAEGQHVIAWYWRCHKKNLHKQFKNVTKDKDQQIKVCHKTMMAMHVKKSPEVFHVEPEPEPEPLVTVNCEVGQHSKTHERIFKSCQEK